MKMSYYNYLCKIKYSKIGLNREFGVEMVL